MNKITIDVVAHHQDNGDGSTTVSLYNNEQELAEVLKIAGFKYTVDDIKDGEDPYYTGTLAKARINLILDDNGHLRLDGPLNLTSDD